MTPPGFPSYMLGSPGTKKRPKYGAKHTWVCEACLAQHQKKVDQCPLCEGLPIRHFDSKREAQWFCDLKLRERVEDIFKLVLQPRFPIYIEGTRVGEYRADFSFQEKHGYRRVIDVKGHDTPLSAFKRRCVEAAYSVKVEVVK